MKFLFAFGLLLALVAAGSLPPLPPEPPVPPPPSPPAPPPPPPPPTTPPANPPSFPPPSSPPPIPSAPPPDPEVCRGNCQTAFKKCKRKLPGTCALFQDVCTQACAESPNKPNKCKKNICTANLESCEADAAIRRCRVEKRDCRARCDSFFPFCDLPCTAARSDCIPARQDLVCKVAMQDCKKACVTIWGAGASNKVGRNACKQQCNEARSRCNERVARQCGKAEEVCVSNRC